MSELVIAGDMICFLHMCKGQWERPRMHFICHHKVSETYKGMNSHQLPSFNAFFVDTSFL